MMFSDYTEEEAAVSESLFLIICS